MPTYDLYGSEVHKPAELQRFVERAFRVRFEDRTSDYVGDYVGHGLPGEEHLEIRSNLDAENEFTEPEFERFGTLLYVNQTDRSGELQQNAIDIPGLQLLRSEDFD